MKEGLALVTGAAGFVGRHVVRALVERGIPVRAGVHRPVHAGLLAGMDGVDIVAIDVLSRRKLRSTLHGVSSVYHLAALVDPKASREQLVRVNAEGTNNVWECSAEAGVRKAIYFSTAAVYGLLAGSTRMMITEDVPPRAVEPYGRSKLRGERLALETAARSGPATVVVRPVAIFGPGNVTDYGLALRRASVSRVFSAGIDRPWKFSFVHVEDVASAAIHLMHTPAANGEVYNVAVDRPASFDEALKAYQCALDRSDRARWRERLIAQVSAAAHRFPGTRRMLSRQAGTRLVFSVWRPGFELTYSSKKLLDTSFRFRWEKFDEVMLSCLG